MSGLDFGQMQDFQKQLHTHYDGNWECLSPDSGRSYMLWMMIEAGEAADIIKKEGDQAIMDDPEQRHHFVEELCDVMMYFNDLALCYGVTPEEIETVYREKHQRNMTRWD